MTHHLRHHTRQIILLLLIVCLGGITALAQDTPPVSDSSDNACNTGGVWEGKCDWGTESEREWAWTCGWYVARYVAGTIASAPEWCNYSETISPTCFHNTVSSWADFTLKKPLDTFENVNFYITTDGTCMTVAYYSHNYFIIAMNGTPSSAEVNSACAAINPAAYGYVSGANLYSVGYLTAPANWYLCNL